MVNVMAVKVKIVGSAVTAKTKGNLVVQDARSNAALNVAVYKVTQVIVTQRQQLP